MKSTVDPHASSSLKYGAHPAESDGPSSARHGPSALGAAREANYAHPEGFEAPESQPVKFSPSTTAEDLKKRLNKANSEEFSSLLQFAREDLLRHPNLDGIKMAVKSAQKKISGPEPNTLLGSFRSWLSSLFSSRNAPANLLRNAQRAIERAQVEQKKSLGQLDELLNNYYGNKRSPDPAKVNKLLKEVPRFHATDPYAQSYLRFACQWGDYKLLASLAEAGAKFNPTEVSPANTLASAANTNDVDMINALASAGANMNLRNTLPSRGMDLNFWSEGNPAIVIAADSGHVEALRALLSAGANPDSSGKGGLRALHFAAVKGNTAIMDELVKNGRANFDVRDERGHTPLDYVLREGRVGAIDHLVELGASLDSVPQLPASVANSLLFKSAQSGRGNSVRAALATGADIRARDSSGHTAKEIAEAASTPNSDLLEIIRKAESDAAAKEAAARAYEADVDNFVGKLRALGVTQGASTLKADIIGGELNLRNMSLRQLPPEIGKLKHLKTLDLSGNRLAELPPDVGQLTKLEKLNLSDNQLAEFPPEIGNLPNLQTLDLARNRLFRVPREISNLKNLNSLNLREQLNEQPIANFGDDRSFGRNELRRRFGNRVSMDDPLHQPPMPVGTTQEDVYRALDAQPLRINRDNFKAAQAPEIPTEAAATGENFLQQYAELYSKLNFNNKDASDYLSYELLSGVYAAPKNAGANSIRIERNISSKLTGYFKKLYDMPLQPGEDMGWQMYDEQKPAMKKALTHILKTLNELPDPDQRAMLFLQFVDGMLHCPTGQKEGIQTVINALNNQSAGRSSDLGPQVRDLIANQKRSALATAVLSRTADNDQNVHIIASYEDKLRNELGLTNVLGFNERLGYKGTDGFRRNENNVLKTFYDQVTPQRLTDWLMEKTPSTKDLELRQELRALQKKRDAASQPSAANAMTRALQARLARTTDLKERENLQEQIAARENASAKPLSDEEKEVLNRQIAELNNKIRLNDRFKPLKPQLAVEYLTDKKQNLVDVNQEDWWKPYFTGDPESDETAALTRDGALKVLQHLGYLTTPPAEGEAVAQPARAPAKLDEGNTPLLNAASNVNFEAIKKLLSEGADPNERNKNGETMLHRLLRSIPDVSLPEEQFRRWQSIAELVRNRGADVNAVDNQGKSIAHVIAQFGKLYTGDSVRQDPVTKQLGMLLSHPGLLQQLDFNVADKSGKTALDYARSTGNEELLYAIMNRSLKPAPLEPVIPLALNEDAVGAEAERAEAAERRRRSQ